MKKDIESGAVNLSTVGKGRRKILKKAAYVVPVVAAFSMADMSSNEANAYYPQRPTNGNISDLR